MKKERQFKVGDIVLVKSKNLYLIKKDTLGYVYSAYSDFDNKYKEGVEVITEDDIDLGGFSYEEQQKMLVFITEAPYKFLMSCSNRQSFNDEIRHGSFNKIISSLSCRDLKIEDFLYKFHWYYQNTKTIKN